MREEGDKWGGELNQWKKRRVEEEEEQDERWGPRVNERERGGPNCGSGAPDVQNEIFSLLNRLQPVRGVLWPNFNEPECLLANCSKLGVYQQTTITLDVRLTIFTYKIGMFRSHFYVIIVFA